ncbi:MAG: cupin domain-containing protein [Pseudomonadota bacterium]
MAKVDLAAKLATFSEHFQPKIVSRFNGHEVMVAKLLGEFPWHKHDDTDDFFLVLKGHLRLETREEVMELGPGDLYVVPAGVEHRPIAAEEVHILLIERDGTPNTGDPETAAVKREI